jgi:transcriptional regulator with XRE-family HTH domain
MAKGAKDCFGEAIAFLIRRKGVTQKQVAEAVGVDQSTVSRWVRKKEVPKEATLDKLAEYLGCHVAMLFLPPSMLEPGTGKVILDFSEISSSPVYLVKKKDS